MVAFVSTCQLGFYIRCTVHRTELEGIGVPRSHEHTEAVKDVMSAKSLWEDYGIVDGIEVSCIPYSEYVY